MGLTSNTGPYNAAAEHFGADDPVMVRTPRLLYNFSIEFFLNPQVTIQDASIPKTFTFNRVVSVTMPDFDYGLVPVNQYNRIRQVPTRMTPGPMNVVFYDTKDNLFQSLMKAYAGHYFQGHEMDDKNFSGYNMLDEEFSTGTVHDFGAKTISSDTRFFFEKIKVHNKDTAQGGRTTTLFNCMMTQAQHTTFDYAQSGMSSYTAQFQPEHINIGNLGQEFVNQKQAERQSLESDIPGRVANRLGQFAQVLENPSAFVEQGQRIFDGVYNQAKESLRNIDGKTFVVPNDPPPGVAGGVAGRDVGGLAEGQLPQE